jgi:uncharacterized protein
VLFNVSTLLNEPVGAKRRHTLDGGELDGSRPLSGDARLLRTGAGVLVSARLIVEAELQCGRCLARFGRPIEIAFDEEFVPEHDPLTGAPPAEVDPDAFRIDAQQHLDLSEAIRQYEQASLPIAPLCRADCAGLCPQCGANRNEGSCECTADNDDSRWDALAALSGKLRQKEDPRGAPQA